MTKNPTFLLVVAAAVLEAGGQKVLIQRRAEGSQHGGLWEFPGGKIEPGEAPAAAVVRELHEELGIAVDPSALVPVSFASGGERGERSCVILLYACRSWTGEPRGLDGAAIAWVRPDELFRRAMPPLDVALADALVRFVANEDTDGI